MLSAPSAFEQGGIFIVQCLLWHVASVIEVLSSWSLMINLKLHDKLLDIAYHVVLIYITVKLYVLKNGNKGNLNNLCVNWFSLRNLRYHYRINNHFTLGLRAMNDNSAKIVVYDNFFSCFTLKNQNLRLCYGDSHVKFDFMYHCTYVYFIIQLWYARHKIINIWKELC